MVNQVGDHRVGERSKVFVSRDAVPGENVLVKESIDLGEESDSEFRLEDVSSSDEQVLSKQPQLSESVSYRWRGGVWKPHLFHSDCFGRTVLHQTNRNLW